jgi:hypothetical protein
MSAPDRGTFDSFADIPDPAASAAREAPPPPPALPEGALTRAELRARRLGALALGLAWIALLAWHFGLREGLTRPEILVPFLFWTLLGAASLGLALRPGERGLPPGLRRIQALVAVVPALYLVTVLIRAGAVSPREVPLSWASAGPCFSVTQLLMLGPLALAGLAFQRSFLSNTPWRGGLVGAVAGLAGAIGIHTHCPVEAPSHILVAHGLAIVSGGLLGAGLGALRGRA